MTIKMNEMHDALRNEYCGRKINENNVFACHNNLIKNQNEFH